MRKLGRNELCPCGSGKKYKTCGYLETPQHKTLVDNKRKEEFAWFKRMGEMTQNGEIHPFVEVNSGDGGQVSVEVTHAYFNDGSGRQTVFDDEIEMSAGGQFPGKATLRVPIDPKEAGIVRSAGDARVTNKTEYYNVRLEGAKKVKATSSNGLFASVHTQVQKNIGVDVCHIYFGVSGRAETVGEDGQKDRPHICLASTGTGLFVRLADYKCSIETQSFYERKSKTLYVNKFMVSVDEWSDKLEVTFRVDHVKRQVIIDNAEFVSGDPT